MATTPAQAYWRQRQRLRDLRGRVLELYEAVSWPGDLFPYQWAQLMAMTLDFEPDLVLELGRGKGNSTCAFTESAAHLPNTRVVSICISVDWDQETLPRLRDVVDDGWLARLEIVRGDIRDIDYEAVIDASERILVFWDAHGFDVAECVLGGILPLLAEREHLVLMHDLSDARYSGPEARDYAGMPLWRRNDWSGSRLLLGNIDSKVEQAVAIVDFTSRNGLELHSADHSFDTELEDKEKEELASALGEDFFQPRGHWFWFRLDEAQLPLTFPAFVPPPSEAAEQTPADLPISRRMREAAKIILGRKPPPAPR